MSDTTTTGPRAVVLGWPITQSRSPSIHRHWLEVHGLAGSYDRLAVPPEEIETFLRALPTSGLAGANVTVPHKEIAYRIATERDAVADATGAVNTLWMEDGKLRASNTDVHGFTANLDDFAAGWDRDPATVVVLGAGGASRAVVWGLLGRGFTVRVVNRTLARAEELVARFGPRVSAHGWDALPRLLADASLLVNTTSLGMAGKGDLAVDLAPLPPDALVTDIVYVPLETPLLAAARARGLATVDGLGMLLHQAVPGFERWFGVRPAVTPELRRLILADIEGAR